MSLFVEIEKQLGNFHLDVRFQAETETLALLGASGCGKSMTLKCIAGIMTPDRGRIVLNGRVLFDSEAGIDLPPQQRRVGYLFQNYALFPTMTVEKNILCGIRSGSKAEKAAGFRDGEPGTWYSDAIDWAAEQGYVTGTGDSAFSPNASISRQEAVTILFRYSGGVSGAELMFSSMYDSQFTDSDSIAPWAESALDWAIYHGVITGTSQTTVSPTATATRAEAAALFVRYSEKIN